MKYLSYLKTPFWRCIALVSSGFVVQLIATAGLVHVWHTRHAAALLQATVIAFLAVIALAILVFYPRRIKPFVRKHTYVLAAALCCVIFVGLGIFTINGGWHFSKTHGESITYDEVSLLPNGYYYQQNGTYFINPEHPPLVKDIAAIPFNMLQAKQPKPALPKKILLQDYAQYYWGKTFLFEAGNNTEAIIFWARTLVLIANALVIFLIYVSLARIWSQRAGFIATFFLTTAQFILGHASLVTVDVMSGLLTVLTLIWFGRWLYNWQRQRPNRASFWLAALCCAGALVSKFSTILLLPVLVIGAVAYGIAARRQLKGRGKRYVLAVVGLLLVTIAIVTVFYAWHVRNMAAADIVTQLHHSYSKQLPKFGLSLLQTITHWGIFGRGFAEFANGILMVNNRIYNGAGVVYFAGHLYGAKGAGPMYFPLLFLTKLQILFLLTGLVALMLLIKRIIGISPIKAYRAVVAQPLPGILAIYVVLFAGIAMVSTLQIGLRHIMPVIMGSMVLVALGVDYLITIAPSRYRRRLGWGGVIVGLVMLVSLLASFPHYISYYNGFAGGTSNGYKLATDSNYDWGQDLKALAAWQQQHPGAEVHYSLFFNPFLPISYYLDGDQSYVPGISPALPAGSYLAVSAHIYQLNVHNQQLPAGQQFHQFDKDLVARVGTTVFIYKIPAK